MKLTKGKISKLYTKINQSAKKRKNNKRKPNKSKTFRKKRKMNLANRSFKKGQFRKYRGGWHADPLGTECLQDDGDDPNNKPTDCNPAADQSSSSPDQSSSSADPSSSSPDLSSSGQAEGSSENINTSTVDDVSQQQDPNLSSAVQAEGSSENIVPAAEDVSQQEQDVVASSTSDASSSTSSSIVIVDPTTNNKGEVILTNEANEALEAPVASSSQSGDINSSQSGDDISSSQSGDINSSQSGDIISSPDADVSSQNLGSSETTSKPINQSNINPNVSSETSSQPSGKTEVSIAAVNALKDIALSGVTSGNNDGIQNGEYAVGMQAGEAASMGGGKNKTKKFKLTKKGKTRNKRE